jgi:6-phosphofructokinase 1
MSRLSVKRIGIITAGGDCPGLNAVIRAVVKSALKERIEVLGIRDGFLGAVEGSARPLTAESVSNILVLGGTILGSSNRDNPFGMFEKDSKGKALTVNRSGEALRNFKEWGLDALVVLGGDGSMTISQQFSKKGVKIVGVPKTIDNDLVGTEQTFGHDTAVAIAVEAIDRLHTTADSHHRAMVVEVMGRNAGWLALRAGLAGGGDAILIPEIPYDEKKVAEVVRRRHGLGKKSSIIVVAEGAHPRRGKIVVDRFVENSPEKIRLGGVGKQLADNLEQLTGIETRSVVLGHVVRGGTPTSFDRILAIRFGVKALDLVLRGQFGRMVALQNGEMASVPLAKVGGRIRPVPRNHELVAAAKKIGVSFGA